MTATDHALPAPAQRSLRIPFTQEHEDLRASIRRFVETELTPHAQQWEDEKWFPDSVFGRLAEHGFLGLKFPEALGGQGGDHLHDAIFTEELARCGSGGLAAGVGAHVGIAAPPVYKFGTPDQHERYLRPAIAGRASPRWGSPSPTPDRTLPASAARRPRSMAAG